MQRNAAFSERLKCPKCGTDELVETGGIPKGGGLGGTFYAYNIRCANMVATCDKCGHTWKL